jgi:predicted NUDIX family NTP pyrophosphohydrolase
VLLVHPGGPFWQSRDLDARSIAKGEFDESDLPEAAARREFTEETGWEPKGALVNLGELRQRRSKLITAFALKAISTPRRCAATYSRWNGHDVAAACSRFPRWTVVNGWI